MSSHIHPVEDEDGPEFTEFGVKINKLRLTFKLRRRMRRPHQSAPSNEDPALMSDLSDTLLRSLDLDSSPRSRIPIASSNSSNANMEFTGFYNATTSSGSSGYGGSLSLGSEIYSEVYSEDPPPLPPRQGNIPRAPARPPYPASLVRVIQEIAEPITR
ncbi:Hypothetical protein FKW44_011528 [Caligus rogercresseyi]|uniref:Uncharacterized protein n=1 Tax=Caligus rogercresseyi TaxID=217165 RepID=A0A7T8HIJ7_CALRO|nr:Hypothetical protein FKW44_011528 [Caligus rogercresseyi]